jgi:hypothetical protein
MAERDLALDCRGGPWSSVRDVEHCPDCLGALPADFRGACSTCGTGAVPPTAAVDTSALDDNGALWALIAELSVPLQPAPPEPPAPKLSRWQRWARWPNHG